MLDRLFDFLASSLEALRFWVVILPYEEAVLMRLGKYVRSIGPGFHWCLPLHIDYIHKDNVVPRTERLSGLGATTTDGRCITFDAVILYRISNIRKAMLEVEDLKDAITDSCSGTICATLSMLRWEDLVGSTPRTTDELSAACRARGWRWGGGDHGGAARGHRLGPHPACRDGAAPARSRFSVTSGLDRMLAQSTGLDRL